MKKIIYVLVAILLATTLSSYTIQHQQIERTKKDTIYVSSKVNVGVKVQKSDENVYRKAIELMQSVIELNESKQLILEDLINQQNSEQTKIEQVCSIYNITANDLFKKARADTIIMFCSSIIVLLIVILGLYILIKYSIKKSIPLYNTITISVMFVLLTLLLHVELYNIMSYIFNKNYLVIKETLNLFN